MLRINDKMNIETKIRNIRFTGELCNFKIAPPGLVFSCLKVHKLLLLTWCVFPDSVQFTNQPQFLPGHLLWIQHLSQTLNYEGQFGGFCRIWSIAGGDKNEKGKEKDEKDEDEGLKIRRKTKQNRRIILENMKRNDNSAQTKSTNDKAAHHPLRLLYYYWRPFSWARNSAFSCYPSLRCWNCNRHGS